MVNVVTRKTRKLVKFRVTEATFEELGKFKDRVKQSDHKVDVHLDELIESEIDKLIEKLVKKGNEQMDEVERASPANQSGAQTQFME